MPKPQAYVQLVSGTGANEVQTIHYGTAADSSTRATALTPTSGKRIRILAVTVTHISATAATYEVYFGTGANITTTAANAIWKGRLDDGIQGWATQSWGDGAGPIGEVDEVVSIRTSVNINTNGSLVITYREE